MEHTAQICLDRICSHIGWPVGHVYLRAERFAGGTDFSGTLAGRGDGRFAVFREASDRCRFALGTGLPGRVLASGKAQWIVDLADEEPSIGANPRGGAGRTPVGIRVPGIGG